MNAIKVLFIDDDVALGQIVTLALNENGYEAHYQTSLIAVKSIVSELNPDIIILDVEIGNKNGIDAAPDFRTVAPDTPILFISSHVDSANVVSALNAGGMAYLKKPFEIEELLAYIKRYTTPFQVKSSKIGIFNLEENILKKGDEVIKRLTQFEYILLRLLMSNSNQIVKREQIEKELWENSSGNEQSINNYIAKLRHYLAADKSIELATIPKVGYKLIINS
ncbi:MAG: response regulator transcription factor [Tannerella sp.]|jgi:DNA-binding response OmpR family regulator|nr:response regulator transcription factor [Tannerella sp.]